MSKLPSLTDLLQSQQENNASQASSSLADLLATSPNRNTIFNECSGSTLTFGSPKHQPSLAELLSSPTAIAGNSTQMGHNKLNPLKGESKSSSSALPSLSELMKQGQHGTSQQHSKS
uniref:Uncharacterized protein n=1 Tax=Clytia hemisphaerica TaxID=252671 RepID=A0A7M5XFZ9_9CNID